MKIIKKIIKITIIVVGALILAFLVLLGFRIATNNNQSAKLGTANQEYSGGANLGFGGIETGELSDNGLSYPNPASTPLGVSQRKGGVSLEANPISQDSSTDRKVMKDGYITAKVENVANAVNDISGIARRLGGEVSSTNFHKNTNNLTSGIITISVPFDQFDTAFAEIKQVATFVTNESISGQDVTEQYVDLNAQLENKKAEEQSLKEILENTDGKVEDVLAVTQELSRVRGEIEQLQGRMRYLESQTDMASISANISEDVTVGAATSWRPWQIVKSEFANMIKDMQKLIGAFIVIVIRFTPILVFIILFFLIIFWMVRAIVRSIFFRKKKEKEMIEQSLPAEAPKMPKSRTRTIAAGHTIKRKVK